ncbi:MAG: 7-cyano-7-deazaguanine synthase QueC [Spirochaetales bacterium]|nr:7-cyano-7-deazaguanine synthase QueC [Spirochaetales bacterium]
MSARSFLNDKALVLTSGGQDSTTCLFWALKNFKQVSAISFYYGQKHAKEVVVAARICKKLNVDLKKIDISFLKELVHSNLFKGTPDVNKTHKLDASVPASFVPYRNLLFLTLASAWAGTIGIRHIVMGVCETDYSGYADCREVFIKSAQKTLNLAVDFKELGVIIHTPLMRLSKAREFRLAEQLGCLDFILTETLTCYNGIEKKHEWGKGCADCPACELRAKGYGEYKRKFLKKSNRI